MTTLHSSCARLAAALLRLWRRARPWRAAACVAICACAIADAAACPLQAPKARVTDLAGLPGLHAKLVAHRLAAYQQASGHQLLVLVVPSLDGMSIEECAVTLFQRWKIGQQGIDDGMLLLVAVKERKMRIEVGYGLEGVLTDAQSSRIIHEVMQPLFARGEAAEGIDRGLAAIMAVIGSTGPVANKEARGSGADSTATPTAVKVIGFFFLLLFLLPSPIMGIIGLLAFGAAANGVAHWMYPQWRGHLLAAVWVMAWFALRWWTIQANVRGYRLANSPNRTLTWIWCFLIFGTAGLPRKARARPSRKTFTSSEAGFSVSSDIVSGTAGSRRDSYIDSAGTPSNDRGSHSSNDSASNFSSDSGSNLSSDSGGASGGGGASGDW